MKGGEGGIYPVVPSLPSSSLIMTLFLSGIQQLLWEVLPYSFGFHWVPMTALFPSPRVPILI